MVSPNSITIIRHGEKPDKDPTQPPFGVEADGTQNPDSLTPAGWQRAHALADLLTASPVRSPFVRPTLLVAPQYAKDQENRRPYETITPLSQALAESIQTPFPEDQEKSLADWLAAQDGTDVLVCWEHHRIPAIAGPLAQALGVSDLPANAQTWPDDDFWSALVFTIGTGTASVVQTSEALMPGDPPA